MSSTYRSIPYDALHVHYDLKRYADNVECKIVDRL